MSRVLNMGPGGAGGPNYRPIDSKREEFRKYLERAGVMDALTKVLVMLYEEPDKPEDALEFVRVNLGNKQPTGAEIEAMKADLASAVQKVDELRRENAELKERLEEAEAAAAAGTLPGGVQESADHQESQSQPHPTQD